jgi:hypothetical protein
MLKKVNMKGFFYKGDKDTCFPKRSTDNINENVFAISINTKIDKTYDNVYIT